MQARDAQAPAHTARAINEVSLLRRSYQAAKLRIASTASVRLTELVADGVLLATPAGSTAYNLSVNGPILPLDAPLLALTPISAFRPRRWRGALLPDHAQVTIEVLEAENRPVSAVADHTQIENVSPSRSRSTAASTSSCCTTPATASTNASCASSSATSCGISTPSFRGRKASSEPMNANGE